MWLDMSGLSIPSVSLYQILREDPGHTNPLFKACQSEGCFYLDLPEPVKDCQTILILNMAERTFKLADTLFNLPLEKKMQWELDTWGDLMIGGYVTPSSESPYIPYYIKSWLGFVKYRHKPAGKHSGVVEGRRDGFESFLVAFSHLCVGYNSNGCVC